jgi:hypothetical protein
MHIQKDHQNELDVDAPPPYEFEASMGSMAQSGNTGVTCESFEMKRNTIVNVSQRMVGSTSTSTHDSPKR